MGGGHYNIPSFRHSGGSDKNQCGGGGGTRASLHSDTVEGLIRISVGWGGGGTRTSLHSDTVEGLIRISVGWGGGGGTRTSLHSDTVEGLIRISVGGGALEHPFIQTQWRV